MKYIVERLDEVLAQSTANVLYGRPYCFDKIKEFDSLRDAIECACSEKYGNIRIVNSDGKQIARGGHLPAALEACRLKNGLKLDGENLAEFVHGWIYGPGWCATVGDFDNYEEYSAYWDTYLTR